MFAWQVPFLGKSSVPWSGLIKGGVLYMVLRRPSSMA
jgi:hypothetical protein